jgi:hypothetical protein
MNAQIEPEENTSGRKAKGRLDRIKNSMDKEAHLTKNDFLNMPSQKGGYDFLPEVDEHDMDPILKARKKAKKEEDKLNVLFLSGAMLNN